MAQPATILKLDPPVRYSLDFRCYHMHSLTALQLIHATRRTTAIDRTQHTNHEQPPQVAAANRNHTNPEQPPSATTTHTDTQRRLLAKLSHTVASSNLLAHTFQGQELLRESEPHRRMGCTPRTSCARCCDQPQLEPPQINLFPPLEPPRFDLSPQRPSLLRQVVLRQRQPVCSFCFAYFAFYCLYPSLLR